MAFNLSLNIGGLMTSKEITRQINRKLFTAYTATDYIKDLLAVSIVFSCCAGLFVGAMVYFDVFTK